MPPPWMPWKWCGVRIAYGAKKARVMIRTATTQRMECTMYNWTISVPTEKGEPMIKMVEFAMFFVWLGLGTKNLATGEPIPANIWFGATLVIAVEHLIRAVGA